MIDIRYHIYSLAAVFFALAVGIVVGTSFAKRSPATDSERRTIQRYENSMRILKREIERTSEGAARQETLAKNSEEFCQVVLPKIAKDRLFWRNVAIIQTGDYDDIAGSVKRALELAGANVVSVTDISRNFAFDDDQQIAATLTSCGVTPPMDSKAARAKLFALIADTVYAGKYSYLASKLEELGVGKFSGDYSPYRRAKMIVLVGGAASDSANTAETVDSQLLASLDRPDVTVVGCESTQAGNSYIPAWHKAGIATVDDADCAMGQIALICALNGEKAKFGVKETADRVIPQTLETK